MTVPVLPPGFEPLRRYLAATETRIGNLEQPQQPSSLFKIASASLTAANAKTYAWCFVVVSDLNITAHSNGVHWVREDTGGVIV